MKTAERILLTSLSLFNQRGESNVSSVDIALELDISPGNLYYHFKGKEIIVAALFDLYAQKLNSILIAARNQSLNIAEFFCFLFLLLEKAHLFRFLLHNPVDLAVKYPSIAKQYKRLIKDQESGIRRVLLTLLEEQQLNLSDEQVPQVVELIGLVFMQAQNYYWLKGQDTGEDDYMYQCLSAILFSLQPYLLTQSEQFEYLQRAIEEHNLLSDTLLTKRTD